ERLRGSIRDRRSSLLHEQPRCHVPTARAGTRAPIPGDGVRVAGRALPVSRGECRSSLQVTDRPDEVPDAATVASAPLRTPESSIQPSAPQFDLSGGGGTVTFSRPNPEVTPAAAGTE